MVVASIVTSVPDDPPARSTSAPIGAIETEAGSSALPLSTLVFGGASFGLSYHPDGHDRYVASDTPRETLLRAFRAGVNAVDTSPFYIKSEETIGKILQEPSFRAEFPRESYYLLTKTGRFGHRRTDFDYSRDRIRRSVIESCRRLHTDHLDVVYLHDVEFVAEDVGGANAAGFPLKALAHPERYGLDRTDVCGPGDERLLEGARALFELRDAGIVRRVGIAGYPLLTLLRLAQLIASPNGCNRPIDIVQSYSHHTLHNDTLPPFVPRFLAAGVRQVVSASPLSMGLLRNDPAPRWHPASPALHEAVRLAGERVAPRQLASVAMSFGLTSCGTGACATPSVVGFSTPDEVEVALDLIRRLPKAALAHRRPGEHVDAQTGADELAVVEEMERAGVHDWSWASPPTA